MTLAITTADPAFDPQKPITVNGYRYVPVSKLLHALRVDVEDFEIEPALNAEGIFVWGPDGERFLRMFGVVMRARWGRCGEGRIT